MRYAKMAVKLQIVDIFNCDGLLTGTSIGYVIMVGFGRNVVGCFAQLVVPLRRADTTLRPVPRAQSKQYIPREHRKMFSFETAIIC